MIYFMNKFLLFIFLVACGMQVKAQHGRSSQPNIIIIYTDDMGFGDISINGGKVQSTPHIDKLAKEGKRFTGYYSSAPVCSPSRVAITTGMFPLRWNINTFLNNRKFNVECEQSDFLQANAPTMAWALKESGYSTAHIGKWHMGGGRDVDNAPAIQKYGFDEAISTWESPQPDPLLTASDWIWSPEDSVKRWDRTTYFVDKTLDFLKKNAGRPCFVNLWPDDVHTPWVSDEATQEKKPQWTKLPTLEHVLKDYDKQIGRLMEGLKQLGLDKNTLVIFTSDNGPSPSFDRLRTNNLRGTKNSLYEGGILMPFIIRWPERIEGGQIDSTSVIASVDLLPAICKIAGAKVTDKYKVDGEDISKALISGRPYKRKRDLFWEYGRNQRYNFPSGADRSLQLAIRHKNWKLFTNPEGSKAELYDLSKDPEEGTDLFASHSKLAGKLQVKLISWYKKNDKEQLVR